MVGCGKVGMSAAYAMVLGGVLDELVLLSRDKAKIAGEELFLINAQINPYQFADNRQYDPTRTRKLLIKKGEILFPRIIVSSGALWISLDPSTRCGLTAVLLLVAASAIVPNMSAGLMNRKAV